ncbi:PREDICTED: claudin-17 [Ficedula albicollis]|uniref:claudin-17 n=1 Tax=Ficedula albicollis TaxID=59894 RepID=UPI0003596F26|nr:PREDICTED: claudin-17 [Ficedula albicollis]
MASGCVLQITGLIFGGVGMVGTLAATAMPQWRVSAYVEGNMVVFESIWEGLWMDCISQLGLRLQCKFYDSLLALPPGGGGGGGGGDDSLLALPPPLEAFRALMCLAVGLAVLAFLLAIAGLQYGQRGRKGPRAGGPLLLAAVCSPTLNPHRKSD